MKRILAFLLAFVLVFTTIPVQALAAGGADSSADINTDDVTIESTNSFGTLIAQAVEAEEDSSSGGDEKDKLYSITDIVVQGSTATVTYDSAEEAQLIVALYTEDGMQLLNTAAVTVSPEEKTAYAAFEGEMPEYFLVSAYLLDVYDHSPLCSSYETPMYTSDMQELLSMDVEDCIEEYGEDRLFNLDENSETNFAVYAETTIVLEEIPGVNVVVSADEETKTYILDNVDERITGLIPGNIVFYTYGDGEILIFKVENMELDGAMATITGGELELDEVFSLMKLESEGDPSNMTMDPRIPTLA